MSFLRIYLLGPPQIELDGKQVTINRRKVLALLVYLAASQRAHQRDHLATLLWPGYDQSSARANLRKTVSLLNQQLDNKWLEIQREQIRLIRSEEFWLDVDHYQKLIDGCNSQGQTAAEITPSCMEALNQAVDLYRDDFLIGFSLPDSPEFTDWQLTQAENYRRRLAQLYETLSQGYADRKEWETAVAFARRWLSLDELEESAHRQLMRVLALKGQRNAALVQYEQCREILAEELEVEPAAETTALYEEIKQGTFSLAEGPATTTPSPAPASRINLPPQLTTFVGRQGEVAEITRLLGEDPACRHVTLFGPGGVGKTRLAIKAAAVAGEAFSDGVTFVSLASLNHPDSLVPTIADALGLDLSSGNPRNRLINYLRRKELLLLLDNFEHLISKQGSGLLSDMLLSAPKMKLLVTSRQRLNLEQEWSVEVFGMSLPPEDEQALAPMEKYEAVQLFLQRARRVRRDFALTNENRADVVRICHLVAGMPLGIELAVVWLRLLSCQEIAQEIEQSLDFLSSSYPNVPQRHHSLRAVFDYSWQLLTEAEQELLARLSVFRGGFTDRAAQRVAGATLPLLAALVDKAMLRRTRARRYLMHELLRQFSARKLDEVRYERERTQDRHAEYYLTLVLQSWDRRGDSQTGALEACVADIDNVWVAWYHALSQGNDELLGKSADGLRLLCIQESWLQEGAKAFQTAVAMIPETAAPINLGKLLREHGEIRYLMGDLAQAMALLKQSVSILRQPGAESQRDLAIALLALAFSCWFQGMYAQTDKYARECLAIATKIQDNYAIGHSTELLGFVATYTGEYKKGVELLERSASLLQGQLSGFGPREGYSKIFLGTIARLRGDYSGAKRILEQLLGSFRAAGNFVGTGYTLRELGYLNIALGDYSLAKSQLQEGVDLFREASMLARYLLVATGLGDVARLVGDYGEAERLHQDALVIGREVGERRGVAICLENLGRLAYDEAKYEKAEKLFLESLERYEEIGHRHGQATVMCKLGITTLSLGREKYGEAEHNLYRALSISTEIGATPLILEVLRGYALLWTTRETSHISHEKTLELLSLILNHKASEHETKENARWLWDKLSTELPAELLSSAINRGVNTDVENVAKEIMDLNPV